MTDSPIVLVVDDEPAICWGFEKLLGKDGYTVLTASSAEEGLQLAEQRSPTLVLLDVRLPGEDGISALPKFRRATSEAPVIVMSCFWGFGNRRRCRSQRSDRLPDQTVQAGRSSPHDRPCVACTQFAARRADRWC